MILVCVSIIPMKKAIILAAGVGKRLGELTKEIPKCLLKVDSKNTLLDYLLESIKDNEIKEVVLVVGFAENKIKEHISKKWKSKFSFEFISNDKFDKYNNIYSAYLARDFWDDETVLFNSDIIFDPHILSNLVQRAKSPEAGAQASYLVVDDTKELSDEDMKVMLNDYGHISKINKNLDIQASLGEYIGIMYLRRLERAKFLKSLEENITNKKFDLYYEDALAHVLDEISILPCSTSGKAWTEVDTKEDYEKAKEIAREIKRVPVS